MANSIEQLAQEEFSPNRGTHSYSCPECADERSSSGQRKRPLRITYEDSGAVWYCHHCEAKGQTKVESDLSVQKAPSLRKVPDHFPIDNATLKTVSDQRGIDLSGLEDEIRDLIYASDDVYFSSLGAKAPAVGFSYPLDGAIKWRSVEGKHFTASGAPRSLYLHCESEDRTVYLTEGEFDSLALCSLGYRAVSSPSGSSVSKDEGIPHYLKSLAADLSAGLVDVVIAVDADEKGVEYRKSLIEFFGRERVTYVDWLDLDVKDANECLAKHGKEGVERAISQAREVLFEGIVTAKSVTGSIDQIRVGGFKQGAKVGIPSLDKLMTICSDQISVVTGVPGSGKSEFIDAIMVMLAMQEDWRFAVFSAENPIDIHCGKLAEKFAGKPIFEGDARMSQGEMTNATTWLDDHFFFLDPSSGSTIKSILDRAAVLVEKKSINGLLIDPFNYTDVSLDTDSISSMLTELHAFARKHHIHIWIVAHPQKLYRQEGGRLPTPTGMDISGSAAWFAKTDFGLTVERGDDDETRVLVWKCRFKWLGDVGTAYLRYDNRCGRYSEGSSAEDIAESIVWEDVDYETVKENKEPGIAEGLDSDKGQEGFDFAL